MNSSLGGIDRVLRQWKPPLVVVLDHADVWHSVKADSPNTVFVGRIHRDDEPGFNHPSIDPIRAAHAYCEKLLPWAERMGSTYDFWQGLNEPVIQSLEAMKRFADFEMERMRLMAKQGFRVAIGSFAVGNPPKFEYWNSFLPALETARHFGAALALHEYAWPTLYHEWPWYLLRHRKVYRGARRRQWYGIPDYLKGLPLLITECGLDGLIEQTNPPRGWQVRYGQQPDRYLEQLAWYDRQLRRDPYVVGAALYCVCRSDDPSWGTYSIWPEPATTLARLAEPFYRLPELERALQQLPLEPPEHPQTPSPSASTQPRAPIPVLTGKETDGRPDALASVGGLARAPKELPAGRSRPGESGDHTQIEGALLSKTTADRNPQPPPPPPPPPPAPDSDTGEGAKLARAVEHFDRILRLLEPDQQSTRTPRDT